MARGPIKKKPAPKAKGEKPTKLTPGSQPWKQPHPMAGPPAVSPVRQQSQKRGKR